MRKLFITFALAFAAVAVPLTHTGCGTHTVTLEQGGAYSDAYLATTDQAILTAAQTLDGFLAWNAANSVFLAKYPEVGVLAAKVAANKDQWIRDAYAARDIYAKAEVAYKAGQGPVPNNATVAAALSVINDITTQINAYKAAHP
jgi:hypothetical protein